MRSSFAARLFILGLLFAAAACNDTAGPTGDTSVGSSSLQTGSAVASAAGGVVYQLGDFALYVPAAADGPRAVLVALGGPNTRAIATGEPFGAPFPPVEAALQVMGASLRALADQQRIAILGTALAAMPDGVGSDQQIVNAIAAGAAASGHPGLSTAPLLLFGLSGGGPEASGLAARHPDRVAGLLLKAPLEVAVLSTEAQRGVPTFMALAEFDVFVDNAALGRAFAANRAGGALWAMATEPGVPHFSFSPTLRTATLAWLGSVIDRRVAGSSSRLRTAVEQSGWLGDQLTGKASPWGAFSGDRSAASWFPTRGAAEQWQVLMGL
ncbi:MAG: hypothetical protein ABIR59_06050 [Gemmatimonadales bacterium]